MKIYDIYIGRARGFLDARTENMKISERCFRSFRSTHAKNFKMLLLWRVDTEGTALIYSCITDQRKMTLWNSFCIWEPRDGPKVRQW